MEEDASWCEHAVDVVDGLLDVATVEAVQRGLLYHAVDLEVRPLLCNIDPLPLDPSLQVSLLALLLVYESPAEVRTNQVLVAPLEQAVQHPALPTPQFQYLRTMVHKFSEQFLYHLGLHVPVIHLLLLQLIPRIPVRLHVVLRQVLRETVRNQELLVLAELRQLVLLLEHPTINL